METVKCATCGKPINPAETQYKIMYEGKIYYFCCSHCMSKFNENPQAYINVGGHVHHHEHGHHHGHGCGG